MNDFWMIVIAVVVVIYMISKRNKFEKLRRSVKRAVSEIGVQIQNRASCLNDALNIAKIGYGHEIEGIERLTAQEQYNQLKYLGERYPSLNTVQGYAETLRRAFDLNNEITASRTIVNGNIQEYNDAITAFPGLIVAFIFRYKAEKFIDEEHEAENRKLEKSTVDFSKF